LAKLGRGVDEDSIASGFFLVEAPFAPWWDSFPGSRHGGATISFTDGHVICHRWLDERTRVPVTGIHVSPMKQPGNKGHSLAPGTCHRRQTQRHDLSIKLNLSSQIAFSRA
jgi:prepilin-type processing-associated H-X9-DG protein